MWFPPLEGLAKGERAARRALELDENLAEAHLALANVIWIRDWDVEGAKREMLRALELNPGLVRGHQLYAQLLAARGELEEAAAHQRRSQELDPFWVSTTTLDVGRFYELLGEDDQAMVEWERALELAPNYHATHQHIGNFHCRKGDTELALAALERARSLSPDDPHLVADLGHCYAISGRVDDARRLLNELEERSRQRYVSPMTIALVYTGLGERERAIEWLERASEARALKLYNMSVDTRYRPLRSEPRFAELVRQIGLSG